jgi:hypothetical protein
MVRPGPGQVLRFAEKVKNRKRGNERMDGVRAALSWVLGEDNKHPLTKEPGNQYRYPPDFNAITKVANDARTAIRRPTRLSPRLPADYCKGVWECLRWIDGKRREPQS